VSEIERETIIPGRGRHHLPLPTMPMAKMELWETSGSASWENLLSVSRMLRRGLDTEMRASARGTARLRVGSP